MMNYLPLTVNHLSLTIDGQNCLDDVNFSIDTPGVYSIVGHNGSGKTLLLNTLAGLISPSKGHISWQQTPLAPQLSWLPTQPVLLNRSVLDNIVKVLNYDKKQRRKIALEALNWAGISHLQDRLATRLSTGEQQQVAIARAKAVNADILLIDEVYANLDPTAKARVQLLIGKLKANNKLLIMTSHYASQLEPIADCMINLENGKLSSIIFPNTDKHTL